MDLGLTILLAAMTLPLSILLIYIGIEMTSIKSIDKELKKYEKSKKYETPVRKYFYWWSLKSQRTITRSSIKYFGDIFVSRFYKLAGYFFVVSAILAVASVTLIIILSI